MGIWEAAGRTSCKRSSSSVYYGGMIEYGMIRGDAMHYTTMLCSELAQKKTCILYNSSALRGYKRPLHFQLRSRPLTVT